MFFANFIFQAHSSVLFGYCLPAPNQLKHRMPRLTPRMIARIQGFPDTWRFGKKKTHACRMIGNAFPPPVAYAVGKEIRRVLENGVLTIGSNGIPSNADSSSKLSIQIAKGDCRMTTAAVKRSWQKLPARLSKMSGPTGDWIPLMPVILRSLPQSAAESIWHAKKSLLQVLQSEILFLYRLCHKLFFLRRNFDILR